MWQELLETVLRELIPWGVQTYQELLVMVLKELVRWGIPMLVILLFLKLLPKAILDRLKNIGPGGLALHPYKKEIANMVSGIRMPEKFKKSIINEIEVAPTVPATSGLVANYLSEVVTHGPAAPFKQEKSSEEKPWEQIDQDQSEES